MANPPASPPAAAEKPGVALAAAGLFAAVFFAYFPALRGTWLWDDDAHVTKAALRSLHGLHRIWFELGATQQYYPVLHSAFWAEHRLWGDSVLGYHLANIAEHALAAWLLVLILRRLAFPAAWLAGVLFALHPVCVESVAWIAEQKNTLSAVFYLASALAYLRFDATRRRAPYCIAAAFFLLALLTKSVTATLPAALLLVLWWRRGRLELRRDVAPLLPWLATAVASGLFTAWVERRYIGAEGADFTFSAAERLLLAVRALLFYAGKLLWPHPLLFIYPRQAPDPSTAGPWLALLALAALLAALIFAAVRGRRAPLTAALFFAGTLFPVLGFVNVYPFLFSFVADHFQYLASLGLLVPAAWTLRRLATGLPKGTVFVLPALLGLLTWRQARDYVNADALNRATLAGNPAAWLAHYNLGVSLGAQPGGLNEAIGQYRATLALNPRHWAAHANLASALLHLPGHEAEAIDEYDAALRLNPRFAEAQNDLGVALGRMPGREQEGIVHLRQAIALRPDYDAAHNNLGAALLREPAYEGEALEEFRTACRLSPGNPEYHYNLANALARIPGRLDQAISEYRAALALRPDYMEAHANLGAALARAPGKLEEAVAEDRQALRQAPNNASIHLNLAHALARMRGQAREAIAEYETALRLHPHDAPAECGLAITFVLNGNRPAAIEHLRRALRIQPDFAPAREILERLHATP